MSSNASPELARRAMFFRTVPTSRKTIAINPTTGSLDLGAVVADDGPDTVTSFDLSGLFIWLVARTLDVTIQRGNAPATAGTGLVLKVGNPPEEFYVAPGESASDRTLHGLATGAASVDVLFDHKQIG